VAGNLTGPIRGVTPGNLWLFNGKHAGQQSNFATNFLFIDLRTFEGFKKFGQDAFTSVIIQKRS
jgi:hypothetical protein